MNLMIDFVLSKKALFCAIGALSLIYGRDIAATIEDQTVYDVTMVTSLSIPTVKLEVDQIRVWHALPPTRPWSANEGSIGAKRLNFSEGGERQYNKDENSNHHFWNIVGRQPLGTKHSFTTKFRVRSATRSFDPSAASVKWSDYSMDETATQYLSSMEASESIVDQLGVVADKVSKGLSPPDAVKAFCIWIESNVKYDASVSYSTTDVAAIIKGGKGHCGHQTTVLKQMCLYKGIPYRAVLGLNLYEPDGRGSLHRIRADWTNVHTWAEVYFPKVGWVEVEPSGGENAYHIPARYIQNNLWFQNYAVWVKDGGKQQLAEWHYKRGKYKSPYNLQNIITFEVCDEAMKSE